VWRKITKQGLGKQRKIKRELPEAIVVPFLLISHETPEKYDAQHIYRPSSRNAYLSRAVNFRRKQDKPGKLKAARLNGKFLWKIAMIRFVSEGMIKDRDKYDKNEDNKIHLSGINTLRSNRTNSLQ